ncbi:MAG: 6-phosphogluconolactonase [Ignavibacteriaceae bacterium]|nr:6-phosphogluconolactonase [Ignavibacteriaceae bacterium]
MGSIVNYNLFSNTKELSEYFAELFRKRCAELLQKKKNIFIALSGGNTPNIYLNKLANPQYSKNIEWERIHIFFVDERMVPPMDPGSNFRTINVVLLSKIIIPEENIHRIKGEIVPQLEVQRYGNEILNNVGKKRGSLPEFDWILLGIGKDGHIASIFPNVELKYQFQNISAVSRNPETGQIRITITETIINNADYVTFIATGKDKAEVAYEILKGDKNKYPAGRINPANGTLEYLFDKDAAALLLEQ